MCHTLRLLAAVHQTTLSRRVARAARRAAALGQTLRQALPFHTPPRYSVRCVGCEYSFPGSRFIDIWEDDSNQRGSLLARPRLRSRLHGFAPLSLASRINSLLYASDPRSQKHNTDTYYHYTNSIATAAINFERGYSYRGHAPFMLRALKAQDKSLRNTTQTEITTIQIGHPRPRSSWRGAIAIEDTHCLCYAPSKRKTSGSETLHRHRLPLYK